MNNRVTCEEAFRQLDDYLDRELAAEEMRLIEEHLAICSSCLREFTFEGSVLDGVRGRLRRVAVPPDLLGRISADLARAAGSKPGTE
jgi:anti-sigma factor (TIGR02949 family)